MRIKFFMLSLFLLYALSLAQQKTENQRYELKPVGSDVFVIDTKTGQLWIFIKNESEAIMPPFYMMQINYFKGLQYAPTPLDSFRNISFPKKDTSSGFLRGIDLLHSK